MQIIITRVYFYSVSVQVSKLSPFSDRPMTIVHVCHVTLIPPDFFPERLQNEFCGSFFIVSTAFTCARFGNTHNYFGSLYVA